MQEKKIIVRDQDGGFIVATLMNVVETPDENFVEVYKYEEYYHSLESAIKNEFEK